MPSGGDSKTPALALDGGDWRDGAVTHVAPVVQRAGTEACHKNATFVYDPCEAFPSEIEPTLDALLAGYLRAVVSRQDLWDHAVPVGELLARGSCPGMVEELTRARYAFFAAEVPTAGRRRFRAANELTFTVPTCLVLAPDGYAFCRRAQFVSGPHTALALMGDCTTPTKFSWPRLPR